MRSILTRTCVSLLALVAFARPASAYPNNEADCKKAGGIWKEKDTPQGCMGFCFMNLEIMHGGDTGNGNDLLEKGDDVRRAALRRLSNERRGGAKLAGDVAISIAGGSSLAAAAATCHPDGGGLTGPKGELVGVVAIASDAAFFDVGGSVTTLEGVQRVRVATAKDGLSFATFLDAAGREVLHAPAQVTLDPKLVPEIPGGDPVVAWTREGAEIDFQWQGVAVRVFLPIAK